MRYSIINTNMKQYINIVEHDSLILESFYGIDAPKIQLI